MENRLMGIALNRIRITDSLFGHYSKLVAEKIIPYQWEILNDRIEGAIPTYCIDNFRIDGASRFRILTHIIIPAIKPAMIVVALLLFITMWNDLLQQMVYINTSDKFTIAIGLTNFRGALKQDWSMTMAATCMSFAPGVIFYLIGQKYFVEGIVMTELKN